MYVHFQAPLVYVWGLYIQYSLHKWAKPKLGWPTVGPVQEYIVVVMLVVGICIQSIHYTVMGPKAMQEHSIHTRDILPHLFLHSSMCCQKQGIIMDWTVDNNVHTCCCKGLQKIHDPPASVSQTGVSWSHGVLAEAYRTAIFDKF